MQATIPPKAAMLLEAFAPKLGYSPKSFDAGDAFHIMGVPFYHPTANAMALIVRHTLREPISMSSVSGGVIRGMRHTSRNRWRRKDAIYTLYIVDMQNNTVTTSSERQTISNIRLDANALDCYWHTGRETKRPVYMK